MSVILYALEINCKLTIFRPSSFAENENCWLMCFILVLTPPLQERLPFVYMDEGCKKWYVKW